MRRALTYSLAVGLVGVTLIFTTSVISSAQAPQATGNPTNYKVTVKKVEFSTDGATTFVTLKEADQEMDIAAVNAGAVAANYASGATLPPGTYNRIRVTISCTIKLLGSVTCPAATCGAETTYYTTSAAGATTVQANQAEGSYTIPAGAGCSGGTFTDTSTVNFPVIENQPKTVNVDFNTAGGIRLDGAPGGPTLSPNTVSVTYGTQ